ncbi:hypothetical protein Bpfe_019946 [Biomphalaria pfeifferi]|uniref:FZ domain-containing protein n=1 Tax=Biomphalaria pfeifferi TaxID=112525 RepID=A0AAD8B9S6_BIOPF|nr:hypothetical protein Bpfe_019946 [Biomphalaria pfeifferi]
MKPIHKNLIISTAVFETLFLLLPFGHVFCQSQSDCHPITQCIPQLSVLQMCQPPFCTLNKLCQVDASYCLNILCNNAHLMCEAACTNLKHLCQNQLTSYSSKVLGVTTSEPPPNEEFSRTYSAIITATYSSNAQKNTLPASSYTEVFNKTDSLIIGVIVSCLLLGVACIVICVLWRRKIKRTPHLDKMCSQDSSVTIVRQSLALNNDYDVIQWVSETQDACSEIPREHKDIKTSAKDYELLLEEDSETYEAIDDQDVRADTQEETSVDRNKAGDSGKDNAIINELDGLSHCGTQNKLDEELNISSASTNISNPYFVLDSNCVTEPYFMLDSAFSGVKEPYFELESASTDVKNPHFVLKPLSNDVSNSYYVSESQDKTSNDTENSSDFYSRLGKKNKIKAVNPYNVKLDDNCIVNDNNDNNARNENIDNNDNNCIINNSANNDNNDNNDNKNKDNTENKHENTNDITMTITYNDENDNNGNDNNKDINDTNEECKKSHNDLDPPAPFGS